MATMIKTTLSDRRWRETHNDCNKGLCSLFLFFVFCRITICIYFVVCKSRNNKKTYKKHLFLQNVITIANIEVN